MSVVVVDSGVGNVPNAVRGLARAGVAAVLSADPEVVRRADRIVLPGVGAFPAAMSRLRATGLDLAVREAAGRGVPILGICLGHQLLFEMSEEFGATPGLALLPGKVVALPRSGRVPHMGWSPIRALRPDPLLGGLDGGGWMYFVHSFVALPEPADQLATVEFGGEHVCAAVRRANVYGVQFHPEKSGSAGTRVLVNFLEQVA
jgi:glutamine amidotransferase